MLRQVPFLPRFFSKLIYELLPAALVSGVGGMLFSHYVGPLGPYAGRPVAMPAAAIETSVSAEMIQMVRDEHGLIVDYLKKYTEARQQADRAAEQEARRIKAAERAAMLAGREVRVAEIRAVAVATHVAEKPETRVLAKQPAQHQDKAAMVEPLRMASVAPQVQPVAQPAAPPVRLVTPAADSDENIAKSRLRDVTATVERIPFLGRSVAEWLSGDTPPPPLPPMGSPPSNWP
jgi:hypothetical protein